MSKRHNVTSSEKIPSKLAETLTDTSRLRKLRIYYINNPKRSLLFSFLFSAVVFIIYFNFFVSKTSLVVSFKENEDEKWMSDKEVQEYLDTLQDTRPANCLDQAYDFNRMFDVRETVSIIITYYGKQSVGHLKLSISALIDHTPHEIYEEIIVIDDGTSDSAYNKKVNKFLSQPKFHKVKLFRSEEHQGSANARFKASLVAKGTILIFVSTDVIVNHGWIQPLIAKVASEEKTIAVPHYDNMLSGHRFFKTDDSIVHTFSWSMYTVSLESTLNRPEQEFLPTSIMRGEVLAVKKSFLEEIGSYDDTMEVDGGGEDLELSLRTWMCGGKIMVAKCSRVAVHSSLKPLYVSSTKNFQHIAELWFGSFKNIAYKQANVDKRVDAKVLEKSQTRKELFDSKKLRCRSINWYLENVAKEVINPSNSFHYFGKLKVKTAYCLRMKSEVDVEMVLCRHHIYEPRMLFEMDSFGSIFKEKSCLTVDSSGSSTGVVNKLVLEPCRDGANHQKWNFDSEQRLILVTKHSLCLTQMSKRDSETGELSHFAQLVTCNSEEAKKQTWEFINY